MSQTDLDDKIFNEFIKAVISKNILSENSVIELKKFITKQNLSEEDWGLMIDKDCFPLTKDTLYGK
ncbi:MAG: hypothetical protein ABH857_00110 [Elusimicrobiota bacterium]